MEGEPYNTQMHYDVWGQTDVGLKRDINQDSILVDKQLSLFVVADGMGGHKGGEVASAMAVQTVQEILRFHIAGTGANSGSNQKLNPRDLLNLAYREASGRIHHKSTHENPELMGMGTTMVAALAVGDRLFIANVGDSRAYLIHNNGLWQLTEDHSLVYEQLKAGVIKDEDVDQMVGRNVITRSVGFERDVQVDIIERQVQPGEMFLLCSDGLSGMVPYRKIVEIVTTKPVDKIVASCIKEAKKAGGDDNVSVLLIRARAEV